MFSAFPIMHSILSILLNTILLFNQQQSRNLVTRKEEFVGSTTPILTVNLIEDTNMEDFVPPMELMSNSEMVSFFQEFEELRKFVVSSLCLSCKKDIFIEKHVT